MPALPPHPLEYPFPGLMGANDLNKVVVQASPSTRETVTANGRINLVDYGWPVAPSDPQDQESG